MNTIKNKSKSSTINYLGVFAICFFTLLTINTKGQSEIIDLSVMSINTTSPSIDDGKIILSVESSQNEFVFQLFDKAPWNGGYEMQSSGNTPNKEYQFDTLPQGTYFVCVTDDRDNSKCEIVTIETE